MNIDEQVELLMQGTDYGDEDLKKAMTTELRTRLVEAAKEGRGLRVYCGYDPRTSDLHLGHTITMRKLRQFQDLGHEVTFLIGTGTSMVGDPSDKDKLRAVLSKERRSTMPARTPSRLLRSWTVRRPRFVSITSGCSILNSPT